MSLRGPESLSGDILRRFSGVQNWRVCSRMLKAFSFYSTAIWSVKNRQGRGQNDVLRDNVACAGRRKSSLIWCTGNVTQQNPRCENMTNSRPPLHLSRFIIKRAMAVQKPFWFCNLSHIFCGVIWKQMELIKWCRVSSRKNQWEAGRAVKAVQLHTVCALLILKKSLDIKHSGIEMWIWVC